MRPKARRVTQPALSLPSSVAILIKFCLSPQNPACIKRQNQQYRRRVLRRTLGTDLRIDVRDNNVEQAIRVLKKKMQREGLFREMRDREHYEKPSEKRARQKAESVRRARKAMRKQMEREGLIAKPKRPSKPAR
jgi:small subunit ribosomal protein S21